MTNYLDNVNEISDLLASGKVILCPTDTIWGLSCNAMDAEAISRIYDLKKRDLDKSCILLVHSIEMLNTLVTDLHPRIETLLSFNTSPLTVIHKAAENLPDHLKHENGTIAIRITEHSLLQEIIASLNAPIISTSANVQGMPSPKSYSEISSEILQGVDYVCNSGRDNPAQVEPSTIISYSNEGELFFLR